MPKGTKTIQRIYLDSCRKKMKHYFAGVDKLFSAKEI